MFKRKHLHRDMADVNVYTARRLKDMAESLGSLARAFAGEVENGSRLGKEDGLAAMQTAAVRRRTAITSTICCGHLSLRGEWDMRTCPAFLWSPAGGGRSTWGS